MRTPKLIQFIIKQRLYSTSPKISVTTNQNVLADINSSVYKPRKHPGVVKNKSVTVPPNLVTAVENVLEDYPIKRILNDAVSMANHLKNKVPPMEPQQIQELRDKIFTGIYTKEQKRLKEKFELVCNEDKFKQSIKDRVIQTLKEKVYNWKPITYDAYNCLVYLIARFPMEYTVLSRIFAEIQQRDKNFKPKSMFDFGSGTGSAMWACNSYYGKLFEYFNVDTSSFMNELSVSLLNGGRGNRDNKDLRHVFYRQFVPASNNIYDFVVSSYSLLELPSFETRMETVLKLWNKTGRYLILVENGTNAGFRVINEARDYLLQISDAHEQKGFVFSPCPHDFSCPRFMNDNTPCNFPVQYQTLPIGGKPVIKKDLFCYVVLRKGNRSIEQQKSTDNELEWPRIVRDTLIRHKHTVCRMCTKHGTLDEVIFTASKHGKLTYQCARATKWGDRLPIDINKVQVDDNNNCSEVDFKLEE